MKNTWPEPGSRIPVGKYDNDQSTLDMEALVTRTVDRDERVRMWISLFPILFLAMVVIAGDIADALIERIADWAFGDEPSVKEHP